MWNEKLAACVKDYSSGVLTVVDETTGYPMSVRCAPQMDTAREVFIIPDAPLFTAGWRGKACLLFHRHNDRLEGLHQLVVRGELTREDGVLTLKVGEFVTANGRSDTDAMPHAGAPLHMLQFLLLGRRKARAYLAKRGEPWPPIPYDKIDRALVEDAQKKKQGK
ncbi:MAG TPA: hypothetical protein VKQ36_00025 [Ktedonobacterales bacterium]|nr:hypothetical protein [Ktedonobacterales bacterium]